jgi:hypothetical protein
LFKRWNDKEEREIQLLYILEAAKYTFGIALHCDLVYEVGFGGVFNVNG